MPDRAKAIKGLTAIQDEAYDRWVHRQYIEDPLITLIRDNIPDVIALLREQEPEKPDYSPYYQEWYCGNCGKMIPKAYKFCNYCGRAVKWDE